jgi:hypothetical protein
LSNCLKQFLLPVQKSDANDCRPVQDLWRVSQTTEALHPVGPNPYTVLALIPAEITYFSCLDSKDTFFCIQLAPVSQPIFIFQWEESSQGEKTVNLEPTHTGFQKLPNHLWICSDIRFTCTPSKQSCFKGTHSYCVLAVTNHQDCLKGTELPLCLL